MGIKKSSPSFVAHECNNVFRVPLAKEQAGFKFLPSDPLLSN